MNIESSAYNYLTVTPIGPLSQIKKQAEWTKKKKKSKQREKSVGKRKKKKKKSGKKWEMKIWWKIYAWRTKSLEGKIVLLWQLRSATKDCPILFFYLFFFLSLPFWHFSLFLSISLTLFSFCETEQHGSSHLLTLNTNTATYPNPKEPKSKKTQRTKRKTLQKPTPSSNTQHHH